MNKIRTFVKKYRDFTAIISMSIVLLILCYIKNTFGLDSYVKPIQQPIIQYLNTNLKLSLNDSANYFSNIGAFLVSVVVGLVQRYFTKDNTVMGNSFSPIEEEFKEKNYKDELSEFVNCLRNELTILDNETNWSTYWFTPLEASVEIHYGKGKVKKKVKNLIDAIETDKKSKTFLVIGDPGGGKSVALRKLCRELLDEVEKTGRVPIYVNLKEWKNNREWTEKEPPRSEELLKFIIESLKNRLNDPFTPRFIDKYFEKMVEHGRIFFVFDSFDEIPAILDVNESSWLIRDLSAILYNFITRNEKARGVLASRPFRKPSGIFENNSVLMIRPFTEEKIREALDKALKNYTSEFKNELFHKKSFLISSARNPFIAILIANYANSKNNELPRNQSELYEGYINSRLEIYKSKISKNNLNISDIIYFCIESSFIMFNEPSYGLEIPLEILAKKFPQFNVENIIDILCDARLGRKGKGEEKRFSFVHRRFNEYFIVKKFIMNTKYVNNIYKDTIVNDLKLRDALVLYCEIAEDNQSEAIGKFCWEEAAKIMNEDVDTNNSQYLKSIHCLRFLTEAFRNRKELLNSFKDELNSYVLYTIDNGKSLLEKKLAIESTGILEEKIIDEVILKALSLNNSWLSECAIRSCRYLQGLSKELKIKVSKYINMYDEYRFIKRKKELLFLFSLSDGMKDLYWACHVKFIDTITSVISGGILFILNPKLFMVSGFTIAFVIFILKLLDIIIEYNRYDQNNNIYILMIKSGILTNIILMSVSIMEHNIGTEKVNLYILIVSVILFIPYYIIYHYVLLIGINGIDFKVIAKVCGIYIGLALLLSVIAFTLSKFVSDSVLKIILTVIFSIVILLFIIFGVKAVAEITKDYILVYKLKNNLVTNRENIAENFHKLKRCNSRCKYLELIRERGIIARGKWPNGNIPNIRNDKSSTLLATLEEKWLGLNGEN
jgi:Predicted NTPase (NACHT family)